jgi:hypothetical protein
MIEPDIRVGDVLSLNKFDKKYILVYVIHKRIVWSIYELTGQQKLDTTMKVFK